MENMMLFENEMIDVNGPLPLSTLYALWKKLGDVPMADRVNAECLEEEFLDFPPGTHREEIWHWFEARNPAFIVGDVMQGIRLPDAVGQVAND
jgi:hypothetical protein